MNGLEIGSIMGGVAGVGGTLAGAITNGIFGSKQAEMNRDFFNYQKQLQREIFQREDTAIQRRAKDLLDAGANPALAWEQGSGADSGSVVNASSPDISSHAYKSAELANSSIAAFRGGLQDFMQAGVNDATIQNLNADASLKNATAMTEIIRQLELSSLSTKHIKEQELIEMQTNELKHNLALSAESKLRTTDHNNGLYNSSKDFINSVVPSFSELSDMSYSDLAKLGFQVGLFALPFVGTARAGVYVARGAKTVFNISKQGMAMGMTYLKHNGIPRNFTDFKRLFMAVTGKNKLDKDDVKKLTSDYEIYQRELYTNFSKDYKKPTDYYLP